MTTHDRLSGTHSLGAANAMAGTGFILSLTGSDGLT